MGDPAGVDKLPKQERTDIAAFQNLLEDASSGNRVYSLLVGFHNMVEFSKGAKFIGPQGRAYKCAKAALEGAPFEDASTKSKVYTGCVSHLVPGLASSIGGEWAGSSVATCDCA